MSSKKPYTLKKFILDIHFWLGLVSGIFVVIICLTGSVLVFQDPVEDWFNRDIVYVEESTQRVPADAIISSFKREFNIPLSRLTLPEDPERSAVAFARDREAGVMITAYFDPYTGNYLGQRNELVHSFFSFNMRMHRWLLVRQPGKFIVGMSTLMFVILLISGIVLWWPKRIGALKKGLTINFRAGWKSLNYQLHNVLGFYSLILLLFMGISGLYISQDWFREGMDLAMGGETQIEQRAPSQGQGRQAGRSGVENVSDREEGKQRRGRRMGGPGQRTTEISYQAMFDSAKVRFSYPSDQVLIMPRRPGSEARITQYNTANLLNARLSESLRFDPASGKITAIENFSDKELHEQYRSINRSLHTGELMGTPMLILYFVACLIGTSLPVTGLYVWINKWRRSGRRKKNIT